VTRTFFKILNVNASPTLSANPTKYPALSVVSGIETLRLDPHTVQVQTNKTSGYGICLVYVDSFKISHYLFKVKMKYNIF
jgi:hypothetical protein